MVAEADFVAAGSSAMILAIRSFKLLLASSVIVTLLIACSIATSTSSFHTDSYSSSSSKIFPFSLREGVRFGSSYSLSSFFVSPYSSSSSSESSAFVSTSFFFIVLAIDMPQTLHPSPLLL